jgi:coatomer subunit beta
MLEMRNPASGEVYPLMIRSMDYFRNNLEKRNENIRAITLRLLSRFREPELLHPLVPSIITNLEHEQDFVRRHALSAILATYHLPSGHMLFPYTDMCELALRAVAFDQDATVRRNAFLLLCDHAQDLAVKYMLDNASHVADWPDLLQMVALNLICKVCPFLGHSDKGGYMKIIFSILSNCRTAAVQYKCAADTLLSLSSRPNSVQVAAKTYFMLLTLQGDNSVNLIILDRLHELCTSHPDVMVSFVMDVLCSMWISKGRCLIWCSISSLHEMCRRWCYI